MTDVVVIGGGPAGSTVARLLALRGFSVELQHRESAAPHSLAETLPPSIRNVFRLAGIQDAVESAGFYRTTGNTSWWESSRRRVESYSGAPGYQVLRADFDKMLLKLADQAGVRIVGGGKAAKGRFVLDCTGRTGVLAREGSRVAQTGFRTLALCGIWRGKLPRVDPTHTLVEAYRNGWVWSIPLAPDLRYVTVMTEKGRAYSQELAKTRILRRLLSRCELQGKTWGCDASLYSAREYSGRDWLLVGDAGWFADPISSFGVKKALTSAWMAAAVVTTCLRHPTRSQMALEFFDQRERQAYADHLRQAAAFYARGQARFATPFWKERAALHLPQRDLRRSLEKLRNARTLNLRLGEDTRLEPCPAIDGEEIVLKPGLVAPGLPPGLEYYNGVSLTTLVRIAPHSGGVPQLFENYRQAEPEVSLAQFLTALSYLLTTRVLTL